jgi:hypothetical protein
MHQVVAVVNMMVTCILLFARDLEPAAAARVLMGLSLGLLLTLAHGVYSMVATEVSPPLPVLIIMTALMLLAFVTANKVGSGGA